MHKQLEEVLIKIQGLMDDVNNRGLVGPLRDGCVVWPSPRCGPCLVLCGCGRCKGPGGPLDLLNRWQLGAEDLYRYAGAEAPSCWRRLQHALGGLKHKCDTPLQACHTSQRSDSKNACESVGRRLPLLCSPLWQPVGQIRFERLPAKYATSLCFYLSLVHGL